MYIYTVGPLPKTGNGNEYAITLICDLYEISSSIPVADKSAKTIARAISEHFVLNYGPMKTLITDQGTEFKNALMIDLCKYLLVYKITSTAHLHQTLGTIERSHRTLNEYVRSYLSVDINDCDVWLK